MAGLALESIAWGLIIRLWYLCSWPPHRPPIALRLKGGHEGVLSCSRGPLWIHGFLPCWMTGQGHQQDIAPSSSLLGCGDGEFRQENGEKKEPREFFPKLILGQLHPYLFLSSLSLMPSRFRGDNMCLNSPGHCTASGFLISLPIDW